MYFTAFSEVVMYENIADTTWAHERRCCKMMTADFRLYHSPFLIFLPPPPAICTSPSSLYPPSRPAVSQFYATFNVLISTLVYSRLHSYSQQLVLKLFSSFYIRKYKIRNTLPWMECGIQNAVKRQCHRRNILMAKLQHSHHHSC